MSIGHLPRAPSSLGVSSEVIINQTAGKASTLGFAKKPMGLGVESPEVNSVIISHQKTGTCLLTGKGRLWASEMVTWSSVRMQGLHNRRK